MRSLVFVEHKHSEGDWQIHMQAQIHEREIYTEMHIEVLIVIAIRKSIGNKHPPDRTKQEYWCVNPNIWLSSQAKTSVVST